MKKKQTKQNQINSFTETFQLGGFDEFATIPITYPLDICLMEVNNNLYAVCLALDKSQNDTKTLLKVLRKVVSSVIVSSSLVAIGVANRLFLLQNTNLLLFSVPTI